MPEFDDVTQPPHYRPQLDYNPVSVIDRYTVLLKDGETTATIYPIHLINELPPGLLAFLCDEFNMEIERGDTFPFFDTLHIETFQNYWFGSFTAVMVLGDMPTLQGARQWEKECLGTFFVKPNYPGRCLHICTAGFLVNAGIRGKGIGRTLADCYLQWAPRLGYTYSIFNLVFESNVAARRIWESLNFKRIGRVKSAGILKGHDTAVDAIIYGRELINSSDPAIGAYRFDKIKFYLETGRYPAMADRQEKSRLRSSASHYRLENGRLMLKGREVISDPVKQLQICNEIHMTNHGGINKTTAAITEKYHWTRIKDTVATAIKICPECRDPTKDQQDQQQQQQQQIPSHAQHLSQSQHLSSLQHLEQRPHVIKRNNNLSQGVKKSGPNGPSLISNGHHSLQMRKSNGSGNGNSVNGNNSNGANNNTNINNNNVNSDNSGSGSDNGSGNDSSINNNNNRNNNTDASNDNNSTGNNTNSRFRRNEHEDVEAMVAAAQLHNLPGRHDNNDSLLSHDLSLDDGIIAAVEAAQRSQQQQQQHPQSTHHSAHLQQQLLQHHHHSQHHHLSHQTQPQQTQPTYASVAASAAGQNGGYGQFDTDYNPEDFTQHVHQSPNRGDKNKSNNGSDNVNNIPVDPEVSAFDAHGSGHDDGGEEIEIARALIQANEVDGDGGENNDENDKSNRVEDEANIFFKENQE